MILAPPRWAEKYLGIPFKLNGTTRQGIDCVALNTLVMREQAGVEVSREDIYIGRLGDLPRSYIADHVGIAPWTKIVGRGEEQAFDWVLMQGFLSSRLAPIHVGIITAPGWLLHITVGSVSRQERLATLHDRVIVMARHDALA